jgi:hypothetical protein
MEAVTDKSETMIPELLVSVLMRWRAEVPLGEDTPVLRITILDPAGQDVGGVELTDEQSNVLAAALADVTSCTAGAGALTQWLGPWWSRDGEAPGAQLVLLDLAGSYAETWEGPPPPLVAPIGADQLPNLVTYLRNRLVLIREEQWMVDTQARWKRGDPVQVRECRQGGVVSRVQALPPRNIGDKIGFWYDVRLDHDGQHPQTFTEDELEPNTTSSAEG